MSKFDFVHLHNHTEYSLLDGMISLDTKSKKGYTIFDYAKKMGMNSVAITDHGNMYGAIEFYKKCIESGIKPIIGSEFYLAPGSRFDKNPQRANNHLVLLAKSEEGYKNLIKLSSYSFTEGFYYNPRIDRELLTKYSKDLVCLSACLAGEIPRLIIDDRIEDAEKAALFYQEVFGKDSFFLEMQIHGIKEEKIVAKALYNMSKKLHIPLVATNDCHYLNRDDAEAQDILLCIGTKNKLTDQKRLKFQGSEFYFKSEEEMYQIFKDIPKALSNTQRIAEMCNVDIKLPGPILPDFEVPQDTTKEKYLEKIAYSGLEKRYNNITHDLKERLNMEIDVINRMGFAGYFLIVWDFIKYAKSNNIWVGPGRGSGAGSIVAYSLGITDIDPLSYDLIFERFLNEKRISMPDFDIDFCQERRQEVMDYVVRKYSKEKVSQIVTFSKMKAKAVIRDVGRVLEIPLSRVDQIAKFIPTGDDLKKEIMETAELKEIFENGSAIEKKLLDVSIKLEKLSRHTSVHAAGVVIGKSEITDFVPLQIVKDKENKNLDIITTQYPGTLLEECGLVKMDFLGLITLTLMRNCIEILEKEGINVDISRIPLDDALVFDLFARGDTDAVFQFESPGMKKYLIKLRPNCLEDLIAMNALYRPGPMNFIDTYIKRKHLEEKVVYDHELLEPVLKETYGIMIYQEQVMKISQVLAGYDLGSADILRRAMGKKKQEEMDKQLAIFIEGAKNNGVDENVARTVFEKMKEFANYGFNKSHAAAYAYVAYQTGYLKAHYPVEFMASVLSSEMGKPDKLLIYISSLGDLNITLLPPDVNYSMISFSVENNKIRYALNGIKGVGEAASLSIVSSREKNGKYSDFNNFLQSIDLRVVNKGVLEILIKCGALDSLGRSRKWMYENLDWSIKDAQNFQNDKKIGQNSLFGDDIKSDTGTNVRDEEWDSNEKLMFEKEIIGFYITGHPLEPYRKLIKQITNHSSKTLKKIVFENDSKRYMNQVKVTMAGIIQKVTINQNDQNRQWARILIEDFFGGIEANIFTEKFNELRDKIEINKIILLRGVYRMQQNGNTSLVIDSVDELKRVQQTEISEFHIYLKDDVIIDDELQSFRENLLNLNGSLSLYFHIKNENSMETILYSNDYKVPNDKEICTMFEKKYSFIDKISIV